MRYERFENEECHQRHRLSIGVGPGKLLMFGVREIAQNRPQIAKVFGLK